MLQQAAATTHKGDTTGAPVSAPYCVELAAWELELGVFNPGQH